MSVSSGAFAPSIASCAAAAASSSCALAGHLLLGFGSGDLLLTLPFASPSHTGLVSIEPGSSALCGACCPGQNANPAPMASSSAAAAPAQRHRPFPAGYVAPVAASPGPASAFFLGEHGRRADRHAAPSLPEKASIHCVPEMNSSSEGEGSHVATRTAKIGFFLLTARSTSRATKAESLEAFDSTRHEASRALDAPDDLVAVRAPGLSRRAGAIQHFKPLWLRATRRCLAPFLVSLGVADEGREERI